MRTVTASAPAARKRGRAVLAFGAFLLVTFGGPLLFDWVRTVPPGTVAACSVVYQHGPSAKVTLEDRRVVWLGMKDLAYPERCLGPGVSVEKRPFELAVRVDGRPAVAGVPTHLVSILVTSVAVLLVIAGGTVVARSRRLNGHGGTRAPQ